MLVTVSLLRHQRFATIVNPLGPRLPFVYAPSCFATLTAETLDFVTNAEVYGNEIKNCGMYDFVFNAGGKNGEGICEWPVYSAAQLY